jgi:hypothetical protein
MHTLAELMAPQGDSAKARSLPDRLLEARLQAAVRLRESVSRARMAELLGQALKRSFHETQWRRYESGESEPPLEVIRAAAAISGLSPAYIAFGDVPVNIDASQFRYLTDEEIARAERKVAENPKLASRVDAKGARKRRA